MYKVYKKGQFVGNIEENFELEPEELPITLTDEALAELGILAADTSDRLDEIAAEIVGRLDEQDAALVELAALIVGE